MNQELVDSQRLSKWLSACRHDPELGHIARWSDFIVQAECVEVGTVWVSVSPDGITAGTDQPIRAGADTLVLRAPAGAWRELADAHAAPRRHDLLALTMVADGIEIVDGRLALIRHLRVLNRMVEMARDHG